MIDEVYQVVKRDGCLVSFDIAKISAAIMKAFESAVSDKMLLTIPTPPTAEAVIRSLGQRGMTCGSVA